MNHARHILITLVLIAASVGAANAQLPDNHSYSSDVAKCAHNPPQWYGFDNRPDCFRNWPKGSRMWDFTDDFRVGADAQNPSQDSYGNANVWNYRRAATTWTPGDWSNAPLFENFGVVGDPLLAETGWLSTKPLSFVGTFANLHAGYSHPDVGESAVIDWRSPGPGRFWINLQIVHSDGRDTGEISDGVRWKLYSWSAGQPAQLLRSGIVEASHVSDTVRLARVSLDSATGGIFLVLDPLENINYDSILFRMTVFGELR